MAGLNVLKIHEIQWIGKLIDECIVWHYYQYAYAHHITLDLQPLRIIELIIIRDILKTDYPVIVKLKHLLFVQSRDI